MKRLIVGALIGGALVYGALQYHIVRAAKGHYLVPKTSVTFSDSYVDVRDFGVADWASHRELAEAVLDSGNEELIESVAIGTAGTVLDRILGPRGE